MARELRLESPGAYYHIINRGNYRHHVFRPAGAQLAFETCLFEACVKSGWVLHAFVVMGNHDHLAVETRTTDPPIPVPFLIQNQPTLPVGRQLRPTDSSRISQSRFLGGV